jgi:YbgC/YbaW family acyl-CoA thioester hydrolase
MSPTTAPTDFRFSHRLRVRWVEVDLQQIVFNGHYLMYFDVAIADYWRALALPYEQMVTRFGGDLYVKKATLEYHASAQVDDLLEVGVRCERIGNSSLTFAMAVFCQHRLLISGELIYVFAEPALQKPKPVPAELRDLFDAFERGDSMTQVRVGSWAELHQPATHVRNEVFVQEQGFSADVELDGRDEGCLHAVVENRYGLALATGRLLPDGHIGRVAVLKAMRGTRAGVQIMRSLEAAAREKGFQTTALSAQTYAQGFYAKLGYVAEGAVYPDEGVPHVHMVKQLG